MNATGNYKRAIKASDLIHFPKVQPTGKPVDPETRRQQALETARKHKAKCWNLIKGNSLDDVHFLGDDVKGGEKKQVVDPAIPDGRAEALRAFINGK